MPSKIANPGPRRAHFIREWRKHRDLTQPQLAELLGTTKQSISRIEKGLQPYTQESLEGMAAILRCSPADLISRDPGQEPDLPIFDLPDTDQTRVRDFIRALRVTNSTDDHSSVKELPDTEPSRRSPVSRKRA